MTNFDDKPPANSRVTGGLTNVLQVLTGTSAQIQNVWEGRDDTVTVFNGVKVSINGPALADVFTNHPNYTGFGGNSSTTGTFNGQGALTHPLSGAPGY